MTSSYCFAVTAETRSLSPPDGLPEVGVSSEGNAEGMAQNVGVSGDHRGGVSPSQPWAALTATLYFVATTTMHCPITA